MKPRTSARVAGERSKKVGLTKKPPTSGDRNGRGSTRRIARLSVTTATRNSWNGSMPIIRRDATDAVAAPPAAVPVHRPDPNAVLNASQTPPERRTIAYMAYALDHPKPTDIPVDDLVTLVRTPLNDANVDRTYRSRIKGRLSAIRAMCVECSGGSPKAARTCVAVNCPLWSFRTGANGMRGNRR